MNRGRPSISIQPQPESAFLAELRRKQNEPRIVEENSRESSRSGASYNSKGSFIPVSSAKHRATFILLLLTRLS